MTKNDISKNDNFVKICPQCKSPDVYIDKSNPLQSAAGLPAMYICNKCNHTGYSFPEIKLSELDEFEVEVKSEHLSNTKKDDTPLFDKTYGNFYVRVMWKILAPFVLLLGFYYFQAMNDPISGTILSLVGLFMIYIAYYKKRKIEV